MKGVRGAAAVMLLAAIGFVAFGTLRPASAAVATWNGFGDTSAEGHDLTPIVALQNGDVMAIGGFHNGALTTDVEILDHSSKTWGPAPSADALPSAYAEAGLIGAQATLLDSGNVLLTGGRDQSGNATALAAVWDHTRPGSAAGSDWTVLHMSEARAEHVAVKAAGGRVVVTGGQCGNGQGGHSDTDVFIESGGSGAFARIGTCSSGDGTARSQAAAVATSRGDVIITGGTGGTGPGIDSPPANSSCVNATDGVAILDASDITAITAQSPGSASWHQMPTMSMASPPAPSAGTPPTPCASGSAPPSGARLRHTATEVEAGTSLYVVVAGGAAREGITTGSEGLDYQQSSTEVYSALTTSPEGGNWRTGQSLPGPRADLRSIRLGGRVLIVGGRTDGSQADPADNANGKGINEAFVYDPGSLTSTVSTPMGAGRLNFTLTTVSTTGGSTIVAVGGWNAPFASQQAQFAQQAEAYTPATGPGAPTPTPTPSATAGPSQRPPFNPGKHPPKLSLPVVRAGEPLRVTATGLDPGRQLIVFIQPVSVNNLEVCGVGQKTTVTVSATGTIDQTIIVFDQGTPSLAVSLCEVFPPPGATVAIPQAVGRATLLMQARGLEPPFIGVATGR